jgi:hypothetical protein
MVRIKQQVASSVQGGINAKAAASTATVQTLATPMPLSSAMEWALSQTRAKQLNWQRKQKQQQGRTVIKFRARLSETGYPPGILELAAEHGGDGQTIPTELHRWEVRFKQHETDDGRVLDGQRLTLTSEAHGHLIAQLFQAVFASVGEGYSHLLPRIEDLYRAFRKGDVPATVTVIPPSMANPLAGSGTVIQVGDKTHCDHPCLEITRFSGQTQLVFRHEGATEKIPPHALQHDGVRDALNQLVDAAFRQQRAASEPAETLQSK